jgi:ABC-type branched-subunit amino acid transport system substrate-binding protein/lipopolysaccharide export system protein LptC
MVKYSFHVVLFLVFLARCSSEVNVGVLLPTVDVDGKLFDQAIRTVQLAIDETNKNPSTLPNTQVRVVVNSTGYDKWQTMEAALWQINAAKVIAIVGGADASEVKVISPIVKAQKIPLVFPSTVEYNLDLDSEGLYPTVIRIGLPDERLGLAVKEIVDHFSWRKLAIIHSGDDYGVNGVRYTLDTARALGYDNITSVYLKETRGPHLSESDGRFIRGLKDEGFRIFIVVLHAGGQAQVLRVAADAGMFEKGYAWVITHCNYGTDLFVPGRMDGIICIRQQANDTAMREVYERMQESEYRGEESRLWLDSAYAYSAAKGLAQALDDVLLSKNEDDKGSDGTDTQPTPTTAGKELRNVLRTKSFFDWKEFFNFQGNNTGSKYEYLNYHNGQFVLFATYDQNFVLAAADSNTQSVRFPGNQTVVPLDTPSKSSDSLRVLVPISYPFTDYIDKTTGETCVHRQDHTDCEFIGVAIRLIKHIAGQIGLGINFTLWTGSWDDLVKQVGDESSQWDMASGSVTATSSRSQHATFSSSIYDSGLRILTLRPSVKEKGYFEFFKPFKWSLWLTIGGTLLFSAIVMLYLDPEAIEEEGIGTTVQANETSTASVRVNSHADEVSTTNPVASDAENDENHGRNLPADTNAEISTASVRVNPHADEASTSNPVASDAENDEDHGRNLPADTNAEISTASVRVNPHADEASTSNPVASDAENDENHGRNLLACIKASMLILKKICKKFLDAVHFSFCVFFAVHSMNSIRHWYSRLFVIVLCFWVLIIMSVYTANTAVFLTKRQTIQTISDYNDLSNAPVGCRMGTLNWDYVKNELAMKHVIDVNGGHHAVRLLKSGEIKAYIADTPHVLGLAAADCDMVVVGSQEQHQKYAFPMKRSLPYRNLINKGILDAVGREFVTDTLDELLDNRCPSLLPEETIRAITLKDIGGLFMIAGGSGIVALVVMCIWRSLKFCPSQCCKN